MARYLPGSLGALLLTVGVGMAFGVAFGLVVAGVLLLILDGRVR